MTHDGERPRKRRIGTLVLRFLTVHLGTVVLKLIMRSWRLELRGAENWKPGLRTPDPRIYGLWHQRLLPALWSHRDMHVHALISRHRDGDLIARIMGKLGWEAVRGSSTRGGAEGLTGLVEVARDSDTAITVDGPKGPRYAAKHGIVALAAKSGRPLVLGTTAASRAWYFGSWDRFMFPKPFARVIVYADPPLHLPRDLDRAGLEAARQDVENRLRAMTAALDREYGAPVDPLLLEPAKPAEDPAQAGPSAGPEGGERAESAPG